MNTLPNHRCPKCGHAVGTSRWFWRAWIWARWPCESCGSLLRFDSRRRMMFSFSMALWFLVIFAIACGCMALRISPWVWSGPLFGVSILGLTFIIRHGDRIALANDPDKPPLKTISS